MYFKKPKFSSCVSRHVFHTTARWLNRIFVLSRLRSDMNEMRKLSMAKTKSKSVASMSCASRKQSMPSGRAVDKARLLQQLAPSPEADRKRQRSFSLTRTLRRISISAISSNAAAADDPETVPWIVYVSYSPCSSAFH